MSHQIDANGTLEEFYFSVSFSEDVHSDSQDFPTGPTDRSNLEKENDDLLQFALLMSLVGVLILLPRLLSSDN